MIFEKWHIYSPTLVTIENICTKNYNLVNNLFQMINRYYASVVRLRFHGIDTNYSYVCRKLIPYINTVISILRQ